MDLITCLPMAWVMFMVGVFFGHPMAHSPKCGATGAAMKACATSCDQELWMSHGKIGGTLKCYNVGPPSYKLVYKPH